VSTWESDILAGGVYCDIDAAESEINSELAVDYTVDALGSPAAVTGASWGTAHSTSIASVDTADLLRVFWEFNWSRTSVAGNCEFRLKIDGTVVGADSYVATPARQNASNGTNVGLLVGHAVDLSGTINVVGEMRGNGGPVVAKMWESNMFMLLYKRR